jgi:hypothetical protein
MAGAVAWYLPHEDRPHYAAFVGATQVTRWVTSRDEIPPILNGRVRCEWRPWEIDPVAWSRRPDGGVAFSAYADRANVDKSGVPLEPTKRRAIVTR